MTPIAPLSTRRRTRCPGCGRLGCPNPGLECGGEGKAAPRKRGRRHGTGPIADGFARWRTIRAEFDELIEAQTAQAETDTRGILLNARGRAAGIDPRTLFYGPAVRVTAYASEELREWFLNHPRQTFEQYQRHHPEAHHGS